MVDLDALIFGYRRASVNSNDIPKLINLLFKLNIASRISDKGIFIIKERDVKSFKAYAAGRLRYEMGDLMGLPGELIRLRSRTGLITAFIFTLMLHIFLSGVIWDIRIEGNERLSDDEIVSALKDSGFEIGDFWQSIDKNLMETQFLMDFPDVSWISINRRGTVAYVRVSESENLDKNQSVPEYSNIIADRDAVIEDIIVESGVAMVKKGDVVRKGDILISGVIENEFGTHICRAEGSVIGQSVTSLSVEMPKKTNEKELVNEETVEIRVNLFKISLNIFKNYRICLNEYDIIENERECYLFGKYKLPLSLTVTKRREYADIEVTYTDDEVTEMARTLMDDKIREAMNGCEIAKLRSSGVFKNSTYFLSTKIVYLTDISIEREFEVT